MTGSSKDVPDVLELRSVTAGYGRAVVLHDVSIAVPSSSVVALLGPNGAGKTTLLRTAAGIIRSSAGSVLLDAADITRAAPHERARGGLCLIPEGRGVFRSLTVRENLRLAVPPWRRRASIDPACDIFPLLGERLLQKAGTLSGGQQQMLALARAFLSEPRVVLLDEVSMGLAPVVVDEIFAALRILADAGPALLIVEQYVRRALAIADYAYLMNGGNIAFSGRAADLDKEDVLRGYLAVDVAETASAQDAGVRTAGEAPTEPTPRKPTPPSPSRAPW